MSQEGKKEDWEDTAVDPVEALPDGALIKEESGEVLIVNGDVDATVPMMALSGAAANAVIDEADKLQSLTAQITMITCHEFLGKVGRSIGGLRNIYPQGVTKRHEESLLTVLEAQEFLAALKALMQNTKLDERTRRSYEEIKVYIMERLPK